MNKLLIALIVLLTSLPVLGFVAQDPTRYIPNARILGLGKAYFGQADDAGSIYTNPAGLAEAPGWQLSSMSGKFLDEYTYLSFSGFYPTNYGVLGFGFAGTSIAGAYSTTIEVGSDPADPLYTIDTNQPQMGNYNNAFVLSYANELKNLTFIPKFTASDQLNFGTNLKIFRTALYGDGIKGGDASGMELDFGLKFLPQKWLKIGFTAQNLLPTAMGGKLKYVAGHEESYPSVLKFGSATNLIGQNNALFQYGEHEVKLLADFELQPTLKNYPLLLHIGSEWNPIPMLSVRAGIDQDSSGDGKGGLTTVTDFAYGVGLFMSGLRFDYAYHTFSSAPEVSNQFLSLSYSFTPPAPFVPPKHGINITFLSDKVVTYESTLAVKGKVVDPRVRALAVNGSPLKFDLQGSFDTEVGLKVGKNTIKFEGRNDKDIIITEEKVRALRLQTFPDFRLGYWAGKPISLLSMAGVVSSYSDNSFKPDGNITRAEMCSILMKALSPTVTAEAVSFGDVPAGHWATKYIAQASVLGIVKGYAGNLFQPNGKISRAEGVSMLARFAGISPEAYTIEFPDLYPEHWASGFVAGAYRAGILSYLVGRFFEPNRALTRAETVEMLSHTPVIQKLLDDGLLNWKKY